MVPVPGIPRAILVDVVAAIPVVIADPPAFAVIILAIGIFGLLPASIAILITFDPHTMVTIRIAAFVGSRHGGGGTQPWQREGERRPRQN